MAKIYYGNQRIDGNEINTENIVDEAITNEKLAANAVSASKIENGSITENKLSAEVQDILDNSVDESALETALSTKQDVLVSEENIKTINGDSILGSGNLKVTTYQPFKEAWKAKTTSSYSTSQFCSTVNSDADATIGMAYLGGAKWNDMPAGLSNCDVVVEILQGASASVKVMHLTITSGAVAPYHWEYTWWSGSSPKGWIAFQTELDSGSTIKTINNQSVLGSGNITTQTVTVADAGGSDVSFDSDDAVKFTAGSNVTLTGNRSAKTVTVAAVDTTYTAGNGLNLSNGEFSVDTSVVATQADLSDKQDTLVSGTNIKTINNESVLGSGNIQIDGVTDYNDLDNIPIINTSASELTNLSPEKFYAIPAGEIVHPTANEDISTTASTLLASKKQLVDLLPTLSYTEHNGSYYYMFVSDYLDGTFEPLFIAAKHYSEDTHQDEYAIVYELFPIYSTEAKGQGDETMRYDDEGWVCEVSGQPVSSEEVLNSVLPQLQQEVVTDWGRSLYFVGDEAASAFYWPYDKAQIFRTDIDCNINPVLTSDTIKTINGESIAGSGNIEILGVTDYDDLTDIPIINQETVYTTNAYVDQEEIHQGDTIHFDTSKETDLVEMLESVVGPSTSSYVTLMSAVQSTDPNNSLSFAAVYDQYDGNAYKFMIYTPYQGYTIYNSNNGGFQNTLDAHGDFHIPTDSSDYYYTVDGSSITTTTPEWNGNLLGTVTISYTPSPVDGKYYRHDENIYQYINDKYNPVLLNKGYNLGKNSIALTDSSIVLGDYAISTGYNLIPGNDGDSYANSLSGSGTTYTITATYSNPLSDVEVGDYLYVPSTGAYAKILTRAYQSMGWYAEVTITVDNTLGNSPQDVSYFKPADGKFGFSEGRSGASGLCSHAEGNKTVAIGSNSHSEGESTKAVGGGSHAEGYYTESAGIQSHAEGYYGFSAGDYSHSEGENTIASGEGAHSEGTRSVASGAASHSEGIATDQFSIQVTGVGAKFNISSSDISKLVAGQQNGTKFRVLTYRNSSNQCPLFYVDTIDTTYNSITIGSLEEFQAGWNLNQAYSSGQWLGCTIQHEASGKASHVEGENNIASGEASHAEGKYNIANAVSQHVFGEYNVADVTTDPLSRGTGYGNYVEIVGNGTSSTKSNARTLDWSGNEILQGTSQASGFKTPSGSSSQFLKADGSVDSNTYAITSDLPRHYINYTNAAIFSDNQGSALTTDCSLRFGVDGYTVQFTGILTIDMSKWSAGTTYQGIYYYSGWQDDMPKYDSSNSIPVISTWSGSPTGDGNFLGNVIDTAGNNVGLLFHDGVSFYILATKAASTSLLYLSATYLRKYS